MMQIEVKTSSEESPSSQTSNEEVSPPRVELEVDFWEKQEDLTLRFLKTLPKTWTTLENAFSSQKETKD